MIFKRFLAKYIKATVIAGVAEVKDVDYEKLENQTLDEGLFIGTQLQNMKMILLDRQRS